ncbi:MAG: histone deacetylase [bacterium]|nr:histone deacetylase [bacterium]
MARTAYYWDPIFLEHDTGRNHVERAERAARLAPERMLSRIPQLDARTPIPHDARKWVLEVHEEKHHREVEEAFRRGMRTLDGGDTRISEKSYAAALRAVDAALTAADAVMAGEVDNAFCAIRPPGHHAYAFRSMGFCLFANIAILARYLQRHHGLGRIAILDWDIHHGNGTQSIFWEDPDVFFVSMHQHPLFPGSGMEWEKGEGAGEGATLNLPMSPGTEEAVFFEKYENVVLPAIAAFRPEIMLLSAGFDAHRGDLLGGCRLSEDYFAEMTRKFKDLAASLCGGRIVSLLEGGYNLDALELSVAAHVSALME